MRARATRPWQALVAVTCVFLLVQTAGTRTDAAGPMGLVDTDTWTPPPGESPLVPAGKPEQSGGASAAMWVLVGQRVAGDLPQDRHIDGPHVVVALNKPVFDQVLDRAPVEQAGRPLGTDVVMTLPLPDGTFQRFRVEESPILAPELSAAFPEFRTYHGQGIDDPTATTRFGWTAAGFHAIVLNDGGSVYIDQYLPGNLQLYVAYRKLDAHKDGPGFICLVGGTSSPTAQRPENQFPFTNGGTLRTYRLALAATGEYTFAAGGTKPLALARMTATMNRVNGIYERDLAVRMTMATGTPGDPTALIYTDGTTDPYTNDDGELMLDENQGVIDTVVGSANYDIGHVFSTGGGGIAYLGSPCNGWIKAGGVTGLSNPTGDTFDVDYVAHEMGHQFGGNHTFNGRSGACGQRSAAHAYEVGSGTTIQAYAGICSVENVQRNSNDYFHVESLDEMTAFLTSGGGSTCGVGTATGNTPPTVNAGSNYTIPRLTPFTLTASGSDPNGDTLTYAWEEFDLGTQSTDVASATTDDGSRPLFRSFPPTTSTSRTFPSLPYILGFANAPPATYTSTSPVTPYTCGTGQTCLTAETMPNTSRVMTFQVTARDNRAGGGGIATSSMLVTVTSGAGPFRVTSPNTATSASGGSSVTIFWDVAGTASAPVSAANVKISLSTDGGQTFPTVLLASTPNDGSQAINMPNTPTSQARIKVEAVGNIFFDVSDTNFTITSGVTLPTLTPSPAALSFGAVNASGTLTSQTPAQTVTVTQSSGTGVAWTASANVPWLTVTSADGAGTGTDTFLVALNNTGGTLPATGTVTGTITITAPGAQTNPTIAVRATTYAPGTTAAPIGLVDTPFQNATGVVGTIGVTGWVVDDIGVTGVRVYRSCLAFEPTVNCATVAGRDVVFVGDATMVTGARTDIEGIYPNHPQNNRAAWGYLLLTNMMPHVPAQQMFGGQGSLTFHALARDADGKEVWLGRNTDNTTPTTITLANDTIAKPFGAIDTPGQGETVSGTIANFGWALTPDANTTGGEVGDILVPVNGSTLRVYIDGVPGAFITYNQCRGTTASGPVPPGVYCNDDVSSIFGNSLPQPLHTPRSSNPTKHRNLDAGRGSIGSLLLNTTTLTNGVHTIMWGVTDSNGRGEGLGSRFFTVLNGSGDVASRRPLTPAAPAGDPFEAPAAERGSASSLDAFGVAVDHVWGRTGLDLSAPFAVLDPDDDGTRHIRIPDLGRLELYVGQVDGGYLVANGSLRDLPPGSNLDTAAGIFTWAPGVGYVGDYRLVFVRGGEQVPIAVRIGPLGATAPGESAVRMALDLPVSGGSMAGSFRVAGWAFDPQAATGSGIGAVHVWAVRTDLPGADDEFIGSAALGGHRPDVAAIFGPQFRSAAFDLTVPALAPGQYNVTAFVWSVRTGRWEDARTVAVTVR